MPRATQHIRAAGLGLPLGHLFLLQAACQRRGGEERSQPPLSQALAEHSGQEQLNMMEGAMAGIKGPWRLVNLVAGAQALEPNLSLSLCDLRQVTLPLKSPIYSFHNMWAMIPVMQDL